MAKRFILTWAFGHYGLGFVVEDRVNWALWHLGTILAKMPTFNWAFGHLGLRSGFWAFSAKCHKLGPPLQNWIVEMHCFCVLCIINARKKCFDVHERIFKVFWYLLVKLAGHNGLFFEWEIKL